MAAYMLGSAQLAEDALHDAVASLLEKGAEQTHIQSAEDASLSLKGFVHYTCLAIRRREGKRKKACTPFGLESLAVPGVEDLFIEQEALAAVMGYVGSLCQEDFDICAMRSLGMAIAEIAQAAGITKRKAAYRLQVIKKGAQKAEEAYENGEAPSKQAAEMPGYDGHRRAFARGN